MKSVQKLTKSSSKKKQKLSPLKLFFMKALKDWCDQPESRNERTQRKKEISKYLTKDIQTLKNMYLYGQGSMDDWFKAMDYISSLKQETIIQMYDSYPVLEEKMDSLRPDEIKLYRYVKEMSESELAMVIKLIEVGLNLNRSIKSKE